MQSALACIILEGLPTHLTWWSFISCEVQRRRRQKTNSTRTLWRALLMWMEWVLFSRHCISYRDYIALVEEWLSVVIWVGQTMLAFIWRDWGKAQDNWQLWDMKSVASTVSELQELTQQSKKILHVHTCSSNKSLEVLCMIIAHAYWLQYVPPALTVLKKCILLTWCILTVNGLFSWTALTIWSF